MGGPYLRRMRCDTRAGAWALALVLLASGANAGQPRQPRVRFQPEEYASTAESMVTISGLGTFQVQHKFGAWGELTFHIAKQTGMSPHLVRLLDSDAAEVTHIAEVGAAAVLTLARPKAVAVSVSSGSFTLVLDAGLNHTRTFQVGLSEQAVEVARRLCRWKDVCLLRKVRLQKVEGMVRRAMQRQASGDQRRHTVQLFDLEKQLGTAPDGWHRDTSHMERCLVCEMQAAAEASKRRAHSSADGTKEAAIELEPVVQLLVDDYLLRDKTGLERRFAS